MATKPDFEALVHALPAAVISAANDEHYTLRFANAGAARLLGYEPEEFLLNAKYTAASAVHPDDLDILERADELHAKELETVVVRYRLIASNGEPVPVLDYSRPQRDDKGKVTGFVSLLLDLRHAPELQGPSKILSPIP